MARYDKPINRNRTAAPPIEQQRAIAAQTKAFLAGGGTIQRIPSGVSGQRLGVAAPAAAPVAKMERSVSAKRASLDG